MFFIYLFHWIPFTFMIPLQACERRYISASGLKTHRLTASCSVTFDRLETAPSSSSPPPLASETGSMYRPPSEYSNAWSPRSSPSPSPLGATGDNVVVTHGCARRMCSLAPSVEEDDAEEEDDKSYGGNTVFTIERLLSR